VARGRPSRISAEEFVRIWQTSASRKEVMEKTGQPKNTVAGRAARYRKRGVPLKNFWDCTPQNWEKLRKLAEELANEEDSGNPT
jgi:hypothetical protein